MFHGSMVALVTPMQDDGSVDFEVTGPAGVKPDEARIKALVASLEGVDIDKAIEKAAVPVATAPTAAPAEGGKEEKKEGEKKKKEEEKVSEEKAAAGLGALFG